MDELTHFNKAGLPHMVDVSEKAVTLRIAAAQAVVLCNRNTFDIIKAGKSKKGDVLAAAQIAGIMAAKNTSSLIPMCHPIVLTALDITFSLSEKDCSITIVCEATCKGETGVEMEAMTGATIAALTVYDMCKAVQRDIEITNVYLLRKSGGKSGDYHKAATKEKE